MKDYLEHTYNIVSTSLDRHLYLKQRNIQNKTATSKENTQEKLSTLNDLRDALKNKTTESNKSIKRKNLVSKILKK